MWVGAPVEILLASSVGGVCLVEQIRSCSSGGTNNSFLPLNFFFLRKYNKFTPEVVSALQRRFYWWGDLSAVTVLPGTTRYTRVGIRGWSTVNNTKEQRDAAVAYCRIMGFRTVATTHSRWPPLHNSSYHIPKTV